MRKQRKRIYTALICACFLLSAVPVPAAAAETGEEAEIAILSNTQEGVTVKSVQAMIDALPDAKDINGNTIEEVRTQFQAIQDAMIQLSVEDSVKLDIARYIKIAVMLYGPFYDVPNPILGTELRWVFSTNDNTLTISGNGEMPDFGGAGNPACPWENEKQKIKKVIIEKGVTNIGGSAFSGCSKLFEVHIPKTVKKIGFYAFRDCTALTQIDIPNSVSEVGMYAFVGCSKLAEVHTHWKSPDEAEMWLPFYEISGSWPEALTIYVPEAYKNEFTSAWAKWKVQGETYTVSFDGDGAPGYMRPVVGVSGDYILPESGFTYDTAILDYWALENSEGEKAGCPGEVFAVTEDVVLYANWRLIIVIPDPEPPVEVCIHAWSEWQSDADYHWKKCTNCNVIDTNTKSIHEWDSGQVTTQPTCTEGGEKVYTCTVCSAQKAETKDALGHNFIGNVWQSDADNHWGKCSRCEVVDAKENHFGGTATCQSRAVCEICNTAYGELNVSNHTGGTEVRGRVESTTSADGYTGDTYCKGCNTRIATGEIIPKKDSGGSSGGGSSGGSGSGGSSSGSGSSGSGTTYYTLTFETNGGGSINAVRKAYGKTIDLSAYTPMRDGYDFSGWYADEALTQRITEIKLNGSTTVYADWTKSEPNTGTNPFTDVNVDDWFYHDVLFGYEKGLISGTDAATFAPYANTTRAQLAVIFYRMEGSPAVEGENGFTDVVLGTAWFYDAVTWAQQNGIMGGCGNNRFAPNEPITREQLAAIFYRYAQYKGYDTTQGGMAMREFDDYESISDYARGAMTWAVNSGLIKGGDNNLLHPKGAAARAEIAAMLHRFMESRNENRQV